MNVRGGVLLVLASLVLAQPASAASSRWLPNPDDATWTYSWSDSAFQKTPTLERYTVDQRTDQAVRLAWSTSDLGNPDGAAVSQGTMDYLYSDAGIVNSNWSSTPPPPQFPVLCASVGQCGNSMAGSHYELIWGSRSPLLQEPLTAGSTWTSVGGQSNDVQSSNRYIGVERVIVPAFPLGVYAARVDSDITQAGAIGDPYGSGVRTTWWVYGVGPVKSLFRHNGGELTSVELQSTNLVPAQAPSDRAYLPLRQGAVARFRYTNSRYLKKPSVQQFTVGAVANNTARVDVKNVSGPIAVAGSYVFTTRTNGVTGVSAGTKAATNAHFPALGPRSAPMSRRRHFFTPLDLMSYGFNPVLKAYPKSGDTWRSSGASRDFRIYGVTGTTTVIGVEPVTVPSGHYQALLVRSTLKQAGFRFGSGVRRAWFAPGVGLVKLEFRHADGSVSRVVRVRP